MSELRTISYDDPFNFDDPTVKRIIDRMTAINRKLNQSDVDGNATCRIVATWYAHQYNGTLEFMQNMHKNVEKYRLSASQIAGILNCMYNDYRHAQQRTTSTFKMPEATLPDLSNTQLATNSEDVTARNQDAIDQTHENLARIQAETKQGPIEQVCLNGTYTVVLNEAGEYRTLRIVDAPETFNKPEGTQIAQFLSGADNESNYTGFAFLFGKQIAVWKKFRADIKSAKALQILLSADRDEQIDLGHAYALASGNCFHCNRKLTVPASISRGLGPICAEKFGL